MGYCIVISWKEGRQEGRKDDLRVQKFSYLPQPLLIPLSARASCFTQHTCDSNPCTLRSRVMTEESPLQWLFAPASFDTIAMAFFSAQLEYFTRPLDVLHRSWTMLMLDKKTIAVCPFAATLIPEPQAF